MAIKINNNDIIDNNRNIVNTGNITINAGIVTASAGIVTYFGDGGNLTNIPRAARTAAFNIVFGL
jgi:lipopolysaccharide export system protein LptA